MTNTNAEQPLVTFALFAYNQDKYIREAIEGAFAQNYEPLEIVLSDDCSTDRTFEIMQEMAESYVGAAKIVLRRNAKNHGIALHFSRLVDIANGEYVVAAAGDDVSLPTRTADSVKLLIENKSINFIDVSAYEIDQSGKKIYIKTHFNAGEVRLEQFTKRAPYGLSGAARTYRKATLSFFPLLSVSCPTEDTTCVLRCLMLGKGYLFNKKLILRRHHDRNLSGRDSMRNMNLDALESQYLSDIKFLSRAGVIQNATSKKLLSWSKSYISNRKLLQSISNKEINFKKMILVFFARKDINLNTRISMLREYLRSNLPISVKLYKEMKQMFKN